MQSWLERRIWVGKGAQATGMTESLRILSSKANSNTWESFTRSELKLESVHQESPCSDVFRKRATKPLLKQKHCQKHLTWAKEKKNWGLIYKRCVRTKWAYNMRKQFSTHISGFIRNKIGLNMYAPWEVRSNEVNDIKLCFHFDMHLQ